MMNPRMPIVAPVRRTTATAEEAKKKQNIAKMGDDRALYMSTVARWVSDTTGATPDTVIRRRQSSASNIIAASLIPKR